MPMDDAERAKLLASYPPDADWFLEFVEARQDATKKQHQINELHRAMAILVENMKDDGCPYQEEARNLRKELIDVTARSIKGRMEAWDLIDRLIPYVKRGAVFWDGEEGEAARALMIEVEEKRKP